MIFLPLKDKNNPPARLNVIGALRQIQRAVNASDGNEYNNTYYPDDQITELLRAYSIHKHVLAPGDKPKCNYCESRIEKAVKLQVEHYRPKALVTAGINDNVELPGYYWLGLEWTNLLLACPKCNGKDAKGNKFPIRGMRATMANPILVGPAGTLTLDRTQLRVDAVSLTAELPILLNPEVDIPENFLTFDLNGNISGHGQHSERGDVSKDAYRLNRDELVIERLDILTAFKDKINVDIGAFELGMTSEAALIYYFIQTCKQIIARRSPEAEYTLWGRYLNDHIDDFIHDYIADEYRLRFKNAYEAAIAEVQANANPPVNNQLLRGCKINCVKA